MSKLVQAYDLAEYEDFINQEQFAGRPLAEYVAEVQRIYCADKRPWVIGYSGGKDSSADHASVSGPAWPAPGNAQQRRFCSVIRYAGGNTSSSRFN